MFRLAEKLLAADWSAKDKSCDLQDVGRKPQACVERLAGAMVLLKVTYNYAKRKRISVAKYIAAIFLSLLIFGSANAADQTLTLGVFAYRPKSEIEQKLKMLAIYLNGALPGHRLTVEILNSSEMEEALLANRLDFVFTNPSHFIELRSRNRLTGVLATQVGVEGGQETTSLGGVILTSADRGDINNLDDLSGKRIAIPGKSFFGGYHAQIFELLQANLPLPRDSDLMEVGTHDKVIEALLSGQAEVGFVRSGIMETLLQNGKIAPGSLKQINKQSLPGFPFAVSTRLYPEWPFVALPHVSNDITRRIARSLLFITPDMAVAHEMNIAGFDVPSDYQSVEQVLRTLRLPPFDTVQDFTLKDLWLKHQIWLLSLGTSLLLLAAASAGLFHMNRRMAQVNSGLNREVALRKSIEHKLTIESDRLQTLLDTASDGIHILDENGKVIQFSHSFANMLGYSETEAAKLNVWDWDVLIPKAQLTERIRDYIITPTTFETKHQRKDGGIIDVEINAKGILLDGKSYLYASARDVTVRKQTEARLADSEAHLRSVIESEPECVKIVDEQGCLVEMSPAGLAMIEADSLEQVVGRPVVNLIAPKFRDAFTELHNQVIKGETMQLEFELLGLKGTHRWLETHAVPMLYRGKTVHLAVTRDITERKKIEEELLRSNAELEQFAYAVSHDLRQPLRSINSYTTLIERRLGDKLDDEGRTFMHFVQDGAKRIDQMLVSLLEYSRIGRSGEPICLIESKEAVDEAVMFLTAAIKEAQAEIQLGAFWPQIYASRNELTRLFQNLIGNAVKYRNKDRTPLIVLEVASDDENWLFSVKDNGIGIASEHFDRLFKVFQRLHSRDEYEGTGVGLAVCRKIVERHDGRIWIESAGHDQGCIFCFTLPKHPEIHKDSS
ncbi:MAG: PhnD/SsuA/transferrin family substrate-binding protein [Alphaproteobacteria bacterium]|nr:PhnD/SsuA/transferrin family substrate-binding protein [Alphaproteobacteria bacterium]